MSRCNLNLRAHVRPYVSPPRKVTGKKRPDLDAPFLMSTKEVCIPVFGPITSVIELQGQTFGISQFFAIAELSRIIFGIR